MWNKTLGGALLVAGTCIGAGMLSLPIATSQAGFYPTLWAFLGCWLLMTITALFMLEVSLHFPEETNLISMARTTLGKPGEIIAWLSYVFFLYAVMTAYTAGGAEILGGYFVAMGFSDTLITMIMSAVFALIVFLGTLFVDWMNRLLMFGLIACYVGLIWSAVPNIELAHFEHHHSYHLLKVAPLMVTAFGFHLLIPSLKNYLNSERTPLRLAIILGSFIPLSVYLLWELVTLGVIPLGGEQGLLAMSNNPKPVVALTTALSNITESQSLVVWVNGFGLCAILSSLVGVALGMFDFFADGFAIDKSIVGRIKLVSLVFVPPVIFVLSSQQVRSVFMIALQYAGVFAAILLVILPSLMVMKIQPRYRLLALVCVMVGLSVIGLEFLQEFGCL